MPILFASVFAMMLAFASPVFATDEEAETELMEAVRAEMENENGEEDAPKPVKKAVKKAPVKKAESKPVEKKAESKKEEAKKEEPKKEDPKKEDPKKEEPEKLGSLECPKRLLVAEQKVEKKLPSGYSSFTEAQDSYWLKSMYIYSGDKKAERLEPYKSTESTAEYMLMDNGKIAYSLVCAYGDTALKVKKPLDKALTKCVLSPAPNPANAAMPQLLLSLGCE